MTSKDPLVFRADSYKYSHAGGLTESGMYPPGTVLTSAYFEARKATYSHVPFFGLQYYLIEYLQGEVVSHDHIDEAVPFFAAHFGSDTVFPERRWRQLVDMHGGRLPLRIDALPEGTVVDPGTPMFQVVNTADDAFWLPTWIETLLEKVWYPCTVAARSLYARSVITRFLEKTGDPAAVGFKLHDFGYRGVEAEEAAAIGGAAHLTSFMGTDTVAALRFLKRYYGEDMAGFSVPASEHSVAGAWGPTRETGFVRNALDAYPTGLLSSISDTYDVWSHIQTVLGDDAKASIVNRDGVFVVRPDSGPPVRSVLKVLAALEQVFGSTLNAKGYRVLPDYVRVIQGDGINDEMIGQILSAMMTEGEHGWSADNIVLGSGGGLLQALTRDTCGFAYKSSLTADADGEREVYKDPVDDHGKKSKTGRQFVYESAVLGRYMTVNRPLAGRETMLQPVFENGEVLVQHTLAEVRQRIEEHTRYFTSAITR